MWVGAVGGSRWTGPAAWQLRGRTTLGWCLTASVTQKRVRIVGVHRNSGTRWLNGRTIVNPSTGEVHEYAATASPATVSSRYLSEGERVLIAELLLAGHGIREIARRLGWSASTISREVRRNRLVKGRTARLRLSGRRVSGVLVRNR